MPDVKKERFALNPELVSTLTNKVASLNKLAESQKELAEELRNAIKGIEDKDVRDINSDALEFQKGQLELIVMLMNIITDLSRTCKMLHIDVIHNQNILDTEIKDVNQQLVSFNEAGVFYKHRKIIFKISGALIALGGIFVALKSGVTLPK